MDEPFIINVADAPALGHSKRATIIDFEPEDAPWPDTGVNIQIMQPGQPNGRYHSEGAQEDFLVLSGECVAIVDGEERPMRQWDFFHCPAVTPPTDDPAEAYADWRTEPRRPVRIDWPPS